MILKGVYPILRIKFSPIWTKPEEGAGAKL
jgi:hypothetical protein